MEVKLGPCTEACRGCIYLFCANSSRGGTKICEYYLETGKHRYPNPDGSCAVRESGARRKKKAE